MTERIPYKCPGSLTEGNDNSGTNDVSARGTGRQGVQRIKFGKISRTGQRLPSSFECPAEGRIKELLASANYLAQGRILDRERDARQTNAQGFTARITPASLSRASEQTARLLSSRSMAKSFPWMLLIKDHTYRQEKREAGRGAR